MVGAIDGSHIRTKKPTKDQRAYLSRNRVHTILLQELADSERKFIHVTAGYPGSIHDSRMLRISSNYGDVENETILTTV